MIRSGYPSRTMTSRRRRGGRWAASAPPARGVWGLAPPPPAGPPRPGAAPPLRCRLLLLSGPATEPTVVRSFAETCVSLLHLPGALAPFAGRPDGPGGWLAGGKGPAELIPDAEWGRSIQDPAYAPRALSAADAHGLSGELVATVDNEALPVIRFRTQERVRVLAADAAGVRISRIAPSPGVVHSLRSAATSMSHG